MNAAEIEKLTPLYRLLRSLANIQTMVIYDEDAILLESLSPSFGDLRKLSVDEPEPVLELRWTLGFGRYFLLELTIKNLLAATWVKPHEVQIPTDDKELPEVVLRFYKRQPVNVDDYKEKLDLDDPRLYLWHYLT